MNGKVPSSAKRAKPVGSGGSRKGIPNKATADIKAAAAIHGPAALRVLIDIAENDEAPMASRVSAAVALLDRGFGKPAQAVDVTGTLEIGVAGALAALNAQAHSKPSE